MSLTCTAYLYSAMKRCLVLLLSLLFCTGLSAQNLLDNSGFEEINVCTEYHATCAPESWFYMRPATNPMVNARLVPKPVLGDNILLLPMYDLSGKTKPLVYTMFLCPLQKGKDYKLSFYLHTAGRKFYNIDIAFLKKEPVTKDFDPYSVTPDLKINETDIVADIKGWSAVEYLFTATEDAKFMLIGNINSFAEMSYRPADGMNKAGMVYYFIDEIVLRPLVAQPPCKELKDNKAKLWKQDLRHTEYVVVEEEPVAKPPELVSDALILPSVLFKTGSAVIETKFAGTLDSFITNLSQKNVQAMQVTGHTDNQGTREQNFILSQRRADAVKQYILNKLPILQIATSGKADTVPVSDNTTVKGRAANRRVEVVVSYLAQDLK